MEEHAWEVRVSSTAGDGAAVFVRTQRFDAGPALSFDREEKRITSLEYVLGSLGAEVVTGIWRIARKHRVEIFTVEATVQATLHNPLTFIGVVGETGDPSLKSVRLRAYVTTHVPEDEMRRVWEEMLAASPLVLTFRKSVDLDLTCKTLV